MGKNNRYIKKKSSIRVKIIAFFTILFIGLIIPFILSVSNNTKAKFWGDTIGFSFVSIFIFIVGLCLIILFGKKEDKLRTIIRTKILGIIFLCISIFLIGSLLPNYYRDIPKIIKSNYSYYEGKLIKFNINHGRTTSTTFTIGDMEFKVDGVFSPNFLSTGKEYHVEYLPNTKFVMRLESINIK